MKARNAVRGEGSAISAFLKKVPASTALIVLFRYILRGIGGTTEKAVCTRLAIHSGSEVSRHAMERFLSDTLGIKGREASAVSQALFGVLDLESYGTLYKTVLCDRLQNPPDMKTVWLSELQSLWPERYVEMLRAWARNFRSPSPLIQPAPPPQPPSPSRPLSRSSNMAADANCLPSMALHVRPHRGESPSRMKAGTPPCASSAPASSVQRRPLSARLLKDRS